MRQAVRWGSYPTIFGISAALQISIITFEWPYWPLAMLVAALGILAVALLERIQPYETIWNKDHQDTVPDILHALFNLALIFASLEIASFIRNIIPIALLWPTTAPLWAQVLLAGFIIDFGLWFMHWLSHKSHFLWRLHALHHSSERLYWLNGERRHPLSVLLLASPSLLVTVALGAPAEVIGCWFSIIAVHLAFQHANLDYTVGSARNLIGVAEIHRWHHKREYEDAQVNFGEFWMIWDHLFGTFRYHVNGVRAGDIGMAEYMPTTYFRQLVWPFSKS